MGKKKLPLVCFLNTIRKCKNENKIKTYNDYSLAVPRSIKKYNSLRPVIPGVENVSNH